MGRTRRRSSALDKSPGHRTNRLARDSAPVPIRSARVNDSQARSHTRASDAPSAAFRAAAQQMLRWRTRAKPRSRSVRRDFVASRASLTFMLSQRMHYTESRDSDRLRTSRNPGEGLTARKGLDGRHRDATGRVDTSLRDSGLPGSEVIFCERGMRWTFCGTLLFLSVARSSRYSSTSKVITGFSDFSQAGISFTFTTEAFTPDLMRWTSE